MRFFGFVIPSEVEESFRLSQQDSSTPFVPHFARNDTGFLCFIISHALALHSRFVVFRGVLNICYTSGTASRAASSYSSLVVPCEIVAWRAVEVGDAAVSI